MSGAPQPVFGRIAVVGLGLLGGSVALAAKTRGAAARVVGATRQRDAARRALHAGAVDAMAELPDAVRDAELVVLATPVHAMERVVEQLRPGLSEGAIVTDVGSVKGPLCDVLPGMLPAGVRYVGSHPMAGSHETGISSARADLFEGAACIVTATAGADDDARERVARFWRALGCRVVIREARQHDAEVAWTSHLPHLLAFAFAASLDAAPAGAREVAGPGFRDFTRIARSDACLWADILSANRKAIGAPLQAFRAALDELARAVEAGDAEALESLLSAARERLSRASEPEASEVDMDRNAPSPEPGTVPNRSSKYAS